MVNAGGATGHVMARAKLYMLLQPRGAKLADHSGLYLLLSCLLLLLVSRWDVLYI